MLFTSLGVSISQASEILPQYSEDNSQTLSLLSPNFTVSIPEAIGGPVYLDERKDILMANIGSLAGDAPTIQFEDTNGVSLYIVRKGDTLSQIAELFDVSVNTITWENNVTAKNLKIGQELRILPVTGVSHTIKKGETFGKIAQTYDVEIDDITIFNDLDARNLKIGQKIIVPNGIKKTLVQKTYAKASGTSQVVSKAQSGYYIKPTTGIVSSWFGPRSRGYHYGIDIANSIGTPIVAAASGTVLQTSCGTGYGICTILQHNNGTKTLYAHTSKLFVKTGDTVKQGQKIANLGNTGRSTGPHLHFEIIDTRTGAKKNPDSLYK